MKILHIGKAGNVERFTTRAELTKNIALIDLPMGLPPEDYLAKAADAEVIIVDAIAAVPADLIDRMPQLKMIHSEGVGYNGIDLETARKNHVYVCNCQGMNASAVAEQTILLMLGMLRDVINCDQAVRQGAQIEKKEGYMKNGNLYELADCHVGLIGFGEIARSLAAMLHVFGAKTYYYKPRRASMELEAQYHVSYRPLEELLSTCNMISLHLPVTEETRNMADDDFFAQMQPGSYFVNTARGELADSAAIVRALKSGKLAMAGLDTIAGEPVQSDNLLLNQPVEIMAKILFSPHIGGITASSFHRGYAMIWENIEKITRNERPVRVVNAWN